MIPIVIIESPFRYEPHERALRYARAALADSLKRGEAPFASHLLYTQVLDDQNAEQRWRGMEAGWAWYEVADKAAVYTDLGVTEGMQWGIDRARAQGCEVEFRTVPRWQG